MKKSIEKYIKGNYSKEDLNNVIDSVKYTNQEDVEAVMNNHWEKCSSSPVGDKIRFDNILHKIHHQINLKIENIKLSRRIYIAFSRVAAIIVLPLLVLLISLIAGQVTNNKLLITQNTLSSPLGVTSKFELPDGTQVFLNSGSTLSFPSSFKTNNIRLVELHGEAFFKVFKNPKQPFIVKTNDIDIKAVGTAFNVRAYNDEKNTTVTLVEGAVSLGKQKNMLKKFKEESTLKVKGIAELRSKENKINIREEKNYVKYTAWTEGRTVFSNDPIEVVTNKFEKLFNVKFIIRDKEILDYSFTATFINENLERALKIISLSSPISYEIISASKDENGTYGKRTVVLKKFKTKTY